MLVPIVRLDAIRSFSCARPGGARSRGYLRVVFHRALVSRCRGDVKVVSRLMSSSVSRLSSLMGCVRMSRGVEGCRGLCRGVSRACRGSECQGVEGVCLWRPNIRLNNNTVCIRYSCCTYSFLQWVCLFIPSTTVFLLLGCSLWC